MFRLLPFALVLWSVVAASAPGHAQDDATRAASARALFEEGIGLAEHSQWDAAADRFRRALSLRDSQVIRFNLAAALSEIGRVVEASELLQALVRVENSDVALRTQAEQRLAQVTPRIAKLTIDVPGAPADARVELDGKALPSALIGVAIPVDPGMHRAHLMVGDGELASAEVVLADGANQSILLERSTAPTPAETAALATPAPTPTAKVLPAPEPVRRDAAPGDRKNKALWWGLGGGAVLIAGAVVAGVLLAPHAKKASPYRGDFEPGSINVQVNP